MCGEYAPPADHDLRPNHERILLVDHVQVHDKFLGRVTPQDLSDCLTGRVLACRHVCQGGAVLDAVQGSPLRSDPAAAGPAGP